VTVGYVQTRHGLRAIAGWRERITAAVYFVPTRKLWTARLVRLVLPNMRKITIAENGTNTITKAKGINSFIMFERLLQDSFSAIRRPNGNTSFS
jgi:hypothetical protein